MAPEAVVAGREKGELEQQEVIKGYKSTRFLNASPGPASYSSSVLAHSPSSAPGLTILKPSSFHLLLIEFCCSLKASACHPVWCHILIVSFLGHQGLFLIPKGWMGWSVLLALFVSCAF